MNKPNDYLNIFTNYSLVEFLGHFWWLPDKSLHYLLRESVRGGAGHTQLRSERKTCLLLIVVVKCWNPSKPYKNQG